MFKFIPKIEPRNHVFKTAGAVAGIIILGPFGLIFGLIGGALIDQLIIERSRKKRLKNFFRSPEEGSPFVAAAAVSTAWYLCSHETVKAEILISILPIFFPDAPRGCLEALQDTDHIDYLGAAALFGRLSNQEQKKNLNLLIASAGLYPTAVRAVLEEPDGETAAILAAAGFSAEKIMPESDSPTDADYAILGLTKDAQPDEVKKVYYNLASYFHPDTVGELTPEQRRMSEDAFKRIKEAYERLKR